MRTQAVVAIMDVLIIIVCATGLPTLPEGAYGTGQGCGRYVAAQVDVCDPAGAN